MKQAANVKSIDALREFRLELKRYLEAMNHVLESLRMESNKAMGWVEQDRVRYWPRSAKAASDEVVEAKNALLRCKMAAMEGQPKSCIDEKKEVERATNRLRHCERMVKTTRSWRHKMRHATEEFDGKAARLAHYVESDLPKAIAALDRMIQALEKYSEKKAPSASSGPAQSSKSESQLDLPDDSAASDGPTSNNDQ